MLKSSLSTLVRAETILCKGPIGKIGTMDLFFISAIVESSSHSIVFQMMALAVVGVFILYIFLISVEYLVKFVVSEIGISLNLRGCSFGIGSCNIDSVIGN